MIFLWLYYDFNMILFWLYYDFIMILLLFYYDFTMTFRAMVLWWFFWDCITILIWFYYDLTMLLLWFYFGFMLILQWHFELLLYDFFLLGWNIRRWNRRKEMYKNWNRIRIHSIMDHSIIKWNRVFTFKKFHSPRLKTCVIKFWNQ